MPVSVVFGGQFGSEGKGKVAHYFAKKLNAKAAIRVGGPNSGHTVMKPDGQPLVLKQLPTASILPDVYSIISSGSYINIEILLKEIEVTNIKPELLCIDPYAVIISAEDIKNETENGLMIEIGSTGSGTGSALSRRINRKKDLTFAKDIPELKKFINNTKSLIRHFLEENERIIIEGTQGFGLSLLHSDMYPFTTSRDTSAAGFVSEAGVSPLDVDDIIMVLRTYPIRVGGNSGPLPKETNWDTITEKSGSNERLIEFTSVTKKIRRVAEFDAKIVNRAIEINRPTKIVLNHVDYFDKTSHDSIRVLNNVMEIERSLNHKINYLGFDRTDLIENDIELIKSKFNILKYE